MTQVKAALLNNKKKVYYIGKKLEKSLVHSGKEFVMVKNLTTDELLQVCRSAGLFVTQLPNGDFQVYKLPHAGMGTGESLLVACADLALQHPNLVPDDFRQRFEMKDALAS